MDYLENTQLLLLSTVLLLLLKKRQLLIETPRYRQPKRFRVHPLLQVRKEQGCYEKLLMDARLSDTYIFFNFTRMVPESFDKLLGIVGPFLTKASQREPISAGCRWGIFFSHPADFTPVCTTELARAVQLKDEFKKRNCKLMALSCDSIETHIKWIPDIEMYSLVKNDKFPFPIIADAGREIAVELQMLDPDEKDSKGVPLTARAVYIIDPKKKMRLSILYPATTGRNFNEILRVLDSLQLCDKNKVATPVDWQKGDDVMVQPTVSGEDCKTLFPSITLVALPSGKNYIRKTSLN